MNKKISKASVFLYGSALVMAGIGSAALYSQMSNFNALVAQYVEQGYDKAEVLSQLVPNQLMPAVYNTVSVNLGFALVLLGLGVVSQKLNNLKSVQTDTVIDAPAEPEAPAVEEIAAEPIEVLEENEDVK